MLMQIYDDGSEPSDALLLEAAMLVTT